MGQGTGPHPGVPFEGGRRGSGAREPQDGEPIETQAGRYQGNRTLMPRHPGQEIQTGTYHAILKKLGIKE